MQDIEALVAEAEQLIDRRNPAALTIAENIMTAAIASGRPRHYAQANYIMAFYNCLVANNYDDAIQRCHEVLSRVRVDEINEITYKIYMTLGNAYQLKGEVFSAQYWYLKGLKELEAKTDLTRREKGFMASFYYNLALVLGDSELKISNEAYLEKAIEIYDALGEGFTFKLSKSYGAYASFFEYKKDYARAIELMHKALELDLRLNELYSIALSKANLGILYARMDKTTEALDYLQQACDYFKGNNMAIETALVEMNLGEVMVKLGDNERAMKLLFDSEQLFESLDNKRELAGVYEVISRCAEQLADYKLALQYHKKYSDSLKQFFDVEKTNALTRAKNEFETEQKEKEAHMLRQKNEEINHYVHKLERSNSELKQFAHVASHDLREPLRMISSYVELLKRNMAGQLNTQQLEFFGFIYDAARRMDHLIIDLLRLAKVDANPRREQVKLNSVVEEIKLNLEMLIHEKNAGIIHTDLPEIIADRTMVLQLFQNLVGNGIKYNESERPSIVISHTLNNDNLEICISDNGIGIPVHLRDKVFRIFNRGHAAKTYQGTGIGLAICKKIVESMEGTITITDNHNGGTIFKMTFPAAQIMTIKRA